MKDLIVNIILLCEEYTEYEVEDWETDSGKTVHEITTYIRDCDELRSKLNEVLNETLKKLLKKDCHCEELRGKLGMLTAKEKENVAELLSDKECKIAQSQQPPYPVQQIQGINIIK